MRPNLFLLLPSLFILTSSVSSWAVPRRDLLCRFAVVGSEEDPQPQTTEIRYGYRTASSMSVPISFHGSSVTLVFHRGRTLPPEVVNFMRTNPNVAPTAQANPQRGFERAFPQATPPVRDENRVYISFLSNFQPLSTRILEVTSTNTIFRRSLDLQDFGHIIQYACRLTTEFESTGSSASNTLENQFDTNVGETSSQI